jgi:hypothetical protein
MVVSLLFLLDMFLEESHNGKVSYMLNLTRPLRNLGRSIRNVCRSIPNLGRSMRNLGRSMRNLDRSMRNLGRSMRNLDRSIRNLDRSIYQNLSVVSVSTKILMREQSRRSHIYYIYIHNNLKARWLTTVGSWILRAIGQQSANAWGPHAQQPSRQQPGIQISPIQ